MAQFATVVAIKGNGTAFAVDAQGNSRVLKVGDALQKGETVRTVGDVQVELMMEDGRLLAVAPAQSVRLDEQVTDSDQRPSAQDSAVATPAAIDTVIQALERGGDLSTELEAAAAGLGGAGGAADGGNSFVRLLRITEPLEPLAYNYGFAAPELPPDVQPVVELEPEEPAVTVGITIGAQVGEGQGGPGLISGEIIQGGVSGVGVPEGSNGGARSVTFLITLNQVATTDVTVTYTIVPGTASHPADYFDGATTGTVTIPAGYTGFFVTENIVGDILVEGDETFTIVLSNPIGATLINDTATVTIVDDDHAPVAVDDANSLTEDQVSISGNVLPNDTDVDGQTLSVVGASITASNEFGTLVIESPGGAYTFTMNEATQAAAQALDDGESIVTVFPDIYRVTDGANFSNFADVTITITGTNDGPVITANPGNQGANDIVFESGLAIGSDAGANSEFASGTFTVSDPDGLDDIQSVTINGETVAIGSLVGHSFAGTSGTLTVTAYSAGVASYTYQLTSATTDLAGTETDVFTLTTSDGTATSAPATITIEIVDDLPTALPDTNSVTEGGVVGGNVLTDGTDDVFGADGAAAGGGVVGVRAAGGDTTTAVTTGVGSTITGLYGTLTLQASGSYSYDGNPDVVPPEGATDVFVYTIKDGDGDLSTTTLTITLTDSDLAATNDDITVNEAALSTGSNPSSTDETAAGTLVGNVSGGTPGYTYALVGSGDGSFGTLTLNPDGSYSYTLDTAYDTSPDADNGTNTENNRDTFTYQATDANGNTVTNTITVDIIDDVPSVTAGTVVDGGITLTTQDAQTIGAATDTASASFAAAFLAAAVPVYGADGAGSTAVGGYTLSITGGDGTVAGLSSDGAAIKLYLIGGEVVGSTAANLAGVTADNTIFKIGVDGNGLVTLTQYAEIDHLPEDVDATNDNTNIALANGLVTLSATATTSDGDGDTATATVSADLGGNISFDDDVPSVTAGTVADGGITLTTQDAQTIGAATDTASASFAAAFLTAAVPVYGADGAGTTVISGYTLSITGGDGTAAGLSSDGAAIRLYLIGGEVVGSTAANLAGVAAANTIFKIGVDGSGLVTLTQYAEIDHLPEDVDATNDNTNIALANGLVTLSATATTTDGDNDTATATVSADLGGNISFDDDVPSVTVGNAVGFNNGDPLPGQFLVNFGADGSASTASGIVLSGFSGTVNGHAIINTVVGSPTIGATTVSYNISFQYLPGPTSTTYLTASGTVVFDKATGSYTFDLSSPIMGQTVFSTSSPQSTTNYDTQGNNSPEIVVHEYATGFFGVLTAASGPSGNSSGLTAGSDTAYASPETLAETSVNYVNVSTNTVGVGSDTIQSDDLINFDFYAANPVTGSGSSATIDPNATRQYASTVAITVDQLNLSAQEDVAVLLKLYNASTSTYATRLLIANSASDYVANSDGTYTITINEADYAAGYKIYGLQMITSTENLTGTGYRLSDGSAVTLGSTGSGFADTSDGDVVKIIKIDVITSTTSTFDTDLNFTGNVVDGDGDTASFSLGVHIEADSTQLTGTSVADTLTGAAGASTLVGGAGNDILTGGGGVDVFKWSLGDQGTTTTPATDVVNDFTLGSGGDVLDLRDLLQGELAGTDLTAATNLGQYLHFTEVGGKAVLQVDHDAGTFAATQTITFDNMSLAALKSGLGLGSGASDTDIIKQMLDNGNLKNTP